MKKLVLISILGLGLTWQIASAQIATKKDVTIEEISAKINEIASKNNEESKAQLAVEAKALVDSKNEEFVNFGIRIYDFIGDTQAVEKANQSMLKKFPKGIKARQNELNSFFDEENKENASTIEKKYLAWLKKFPASNFDSKNQGIYDQGKSNMTIVYFKEGNQTKANEYLNQLKESKNFPIYAVAIANSLLKSEQYSTALPIVSSAYDLAENAFTSSDPEIKRSNIAGRYISLATIYAQTLNKTNDIDKNIEILEKLFNDYPYSKTSADNIILLADAYSKVGRDLDAFNILDNFLITQSLNEKILATITPLYQKLNNNKGVFDRYLANVKAKANEAIITKYKSEMIKKEAPNFSLVNMKGETVSLADLKGKVVVLDFWATWCGPCKISFPGMQAAVNKYQDDKEVEFLFIDTWQREENYKEIVEKFIADNKYTFNVIYDEMKDRKKATTTAYGVEGIPHKVVIDKEGFIRFESSGGSDNIEQIVNEMSTKIELAKKG